MIEFSDKEKVLFKCIKDYAQSLRCDAVPRLAGGFVRDRLLGIASHDIDIALENISGLTFATGLSKSLNSQPTVHKISANPEKSKHLETAVLTLFGYSIDFVHLRAESYADSRIPIIIPGTPKEDAERRDITINSLFYNLVTDEIEDFTGRGLNDINNGIIDTPIDPKITLFDDPLRILRIFRFKSKFGFEISKRVYEAIADKKIKEALEKKVSNERNFIEIEKMLCYKNGEIGLIEIIANGYVPSIFKPAVSVEINIKTAHSFIEFKGKFLNVADDYLALFESKKLDLSITKLYIILQFFQGLKVKSKKKFEFVNSQIIRDGLKASRSMTKTVESIESFLEIFSTSTEIQVNYNKIDELVIDPVDFVLECKDLWFETLLILYSTTKSEIFLNLMPIIFQKNLQECYSAKPLITGQDLIAMGTHPLDFSRKLRKSLELQIKHPNMTQGDILNQLNQI